MFRRLTLKDFGAEKCVNLLQPIKNDHGSYGYAILETKQDVVNLAGTLLEDTDCSNAWIFMLMKHSICGAFTDEDGVHAFSVSNQDGDDMIMNLDDQIKYIKSVVKEQKPHCIGIMQNTEDNLYRVVMETIYDKRVIRNGKIKQRRN